VPSVNIRWGSRQNHSKANEESIETGSAKGIQGVKKEERLFYLFACSSGAPDESPQTVFYVTRGESVANFLVGLFLREYDDNDAAFRLKDAESISPEEEVLLDEMLDVLAIYDEPDRGVYDPEPSADVHLRAQYAVRARKWEELFRRRITAGDRDSDPGDKESAGRERPVDEVSEVSPEEERNSVLILLMLVAQAYYQMLECTISTASIVTELDLELNQSYLWTVETITNLLKNSVHLGDFPVPFKPLFGDLYPSTIGDLEWQGMVAVDAEEFLSTVQRYVLAKGTYEPPKGSPGWCFIELYRPSVNAAIERAVKYDARMRKHYQRFLASTSKTTEARTRSEPKSTSLPTSSTSTCARDKIFVSYSHKDKPQFEEFKRMLAPALRTGAIEVWDDTKIRSGTRWEDEIRTALSSTKIAVLLVSDHFLASDFIVKKELQPLLEASSNEGVIILWLCLTHCNYELLEIQSLQCAHDVSRPLDTLSRPKRKGILKKIVTELIERAQGS
jgi:TIR domain-containing protein